MKVAVIGTGAIGRAWGISFARGGHDVYFYNRTPDKAREALEFARAIVGDLERYDLLNGHSAADTLARLHVANSLEEALDDAGYAQENLAEDVALKAQMFLEMERFAPIESVLASSTSGIPASAFTDKLVHRERCLVAHPLNPPYVIPAVDLIPSPWTSPAVMDWTAEFLTNCGQSPIRMKAEDPGFLTIRLQGALYHEAFRLVAEGLADPEAVDACIRDGLALRWSFIGPFETADLNAPCGVRQFVERFGQQYQNLYPRGGPFAWDGKVMDEVERARREKLPIGDHQARQLWRDRRLIALIAHKREQDKNDRRAES